MTKYSGPSLSAPTQIFSPLVTMPKTQKLPERRLIGNRKVEPPWNSFAGIDSVVRDEEILIRKHLGFILSKELQTRDATRRAIEVNDFTRHLENQRAFRHDRGGIVTQLGENLRIRQ